MTRTRPAPVRLATAVMPVITALALTAGCAAGSTAQEQGHPTGGSTASRQGHPTGDSHTPTAADVTFKAAIDGGQVSPPPHRAKVKRGQTVRLVIISDHPDQVHVHGYDIEKPVGPDGPTVITFTADTPGVFEIEAHHPELQLLQLQVG